VAQDNADQVAVIDTTTNRITARIDARAPEGTLPREEIHGRGNIGRDAVARWRHAHAVNSGSNSIAVIPLEGKRRAVSGLIPTAYEPHDITFSADGSWMTSSAARVTGPNPGHPGWRHGQHHQHHLPRRKCRGAAAARASNQYQFQLRGRHSSAHLPRVRHLHELTETVARNWGTDRDQ
jgi:hypothetical protein